MTAQLPSTTTLWNVSGGFIAWTLIAFANSALDCSNTFEATKRSPPSSHGHAT